MRLLNWLFSDWPYWYWGSCSKAFKQSHVCVWDWGERYWGTPVPLNPHLLKTRLLGYFLPEGLQPSCSEKLGRDHTHAHGPKPTYSGEVSFHTWLTRYTIISCLVSVMLKKLQHGWIGGFWHSGWELNPTSAWQCACRGFVVGANASAWWQ